MGQHTLNARTRGQSSQSRAYEGKEDRDIKFEVQNADYGSGYDEFDDDDDDFRLIARTLFPEIWQYSKLSKAFPRDPLGTKSNCMNDDDDSDGDVFDCTPNCYLCHRRAQAEIYEIKQFGDGYDIDYYVEDDGWDSDDTEPETHHQTECVHCVRERLKAEGWKFPYEQYEEKSARKTSETDKPKDQQAQKKQPVKDEEPLPMISQVFSRPPPVLQAETNSTEPISSPRVFFPPSQDSDQDRQPVFVPPPKSSKTIASRVFFPPSKVLDITAVPRVVFSPPEA